jgi:hypothetical protein
MVMLAPSFCINCVTKAILRLIEDQETAVYVHSGTQLAISNHIFKTNTRPIKSTY